ncbi:DUF4397 domain-containing protein [Mucilaginibacter gotjawali]|uniref:Uncharacterized protein n=2 Tax=Mucilaginibacter gotjawali TaxID=1550579 RepID=A0A839SH44_9SPHI|nr:DUF4397 domain-containing protein [Mucilaginibacter gotjawali]MBB3056614.1 hypothetical protein [Mucilaginibacter gotjawali]BAU52683.1 hypothetical protein MgSA37_00845 [Mucilaginibacter gotjawali]
MKNSTKNLKSILTTVLALGLPVLFLASCSKPVVNGNVSTPIAGVAFVQASPDQPVLDIFFNNTKYNTTPISYGNTFSYATVNAGKVPVALYNDATVKAIVTDTLTLLQNVAYSLFLTNTVSHPQLFLLPDTLSKPAGSDAAIRFIDLSPDAPAVDLVIKSGSTLASNMTFKEHSTFIPVQADFYTLEVHAAGTSTVLATLNNLKFQSGFLYTVWFHGLNAGTTSTDKLAVDIITNTYFM